MKNELSLFLVLAFCPLLSFAQNSSGQKIAFERNNDTVWIANPDGTGAKQIGRGQLPAFSPDGTKLAYNTVQDNGQPAHRQLTVVDLSTGQSTLLKDVPSTNCMCGGWSPDGKRLIFDYYANNERYIGIINADGTGFIDVQKSEPKHQTYWSETWAADGRSFFAQDMENLYQLTLDAKVLKKWHIEKLVPHGDMGGDVCLDASPDGKLLLMDIEMDEKEKPGWDGPPPAIWTLDLATDKVTRITPKSLYGWDCHWLKAPDSILFTGIYPGKNKRAVYSMSTRGQGKDVKLLTKDGSYPTASR